MEKIDSERKIGVRGWGGETGEGDRIGEKRGFYAKKLRKGKLNRKDQQIQWEKIIGKSTPDVVI